MSAEVLRCSEVAAMAAHMNNKLDAPEANGQLDPKAAQGLNPPHIAAQKRTYEERVVKLIQPYDDDTEFGIPGWIRSPDGGLKCIDEAEMSRQKGVLSHMIRNIGSNLINGISVINVSLPVRIFEPRSFLQRIPDAWCYAPLFLTKAAFAANPVERLQWVMTFVVSGLHRGSTNLKPFNPILGETYQATFEDGTDVMLEQTSHHPPVSSFQVIGPERIYHMYGYHEFSASMRPNSITGEQIGPNSIEFLDGTVITYQMPHVLLQGTLIGERNFQWLGTVHFADQKNNLYCDLAFNPDAKNAFSRLFSAQKTPCDAVRGAIYRKVPKPNKPNDFLKEEISKCEGSWMDGIGFDGQPFWSKKTVRPFRIKPIDNPLPSDCRFREDLQFLLANNHEEAQKWKQILEERQRHDRTLRKNGLKLRKKVQQLAAKHKRTESQSSQPQAEPLSPVSDTRPEPCKSVP